MCVGGVQLGSDEQKASTFTTAATAQNRAKTIPTLRPIRVTLGWWPRNRIPAAPIDVTAAYVDAQLTMMLARIAAGNFPDIVRTHADLAFAVLTGVDGSGR